MMSSARGDSSTGSELKAVEEACREASRTVEPCVLCTTIVERFRGLRKFCGVGPLPETLMTQHPVLLLCVILRSVATKNLLLTFLSWSKELGKVQSRCFISFSMTQQQTANAPKDSDFFGVLCAFAREIQLLVAA
jgi:hypothetical protein